MKGKRFVRTEDEIAAALNEVGCGAGDLLLVHADMGICWPEGAKSRQKALEGHYRAIRKVLGEAGTIMVPCFHTDFCKGVDYNLAETKSQLVGSFGDYLRGLPGCHRSKHPIFNFACIGPLAENITAPMDYSAFGPGSIFERALREDGKILFYGAPFQTCTFAHHVEQVYGVPYRFVKPFWGRVILPDREIYDYFNYFVRPLEEPYQLTLAPFEEHLRERGLMRHVSFGLGEISLVSMSDFLVEAFRLLSHSPNFFLTEEPKRYWTYWKGRELVQMKPIVTKLHPLNRVLISHDYEKALDYLAEVLLPFGPLQIHRIPCGTIAWAWQVPRFWKLREAYIEYEGRRILDVRDNILHVVLGSLPVDWTVDLNELRAHLHTRPDRPKAVPYEFKYYELSESDWGFCLTHEQASHLKHGSYHVVIKSEYTDGSLSVGEYILRGEEETGIIITTHLDHPGQSNDGLSSCAVAVGLIQRLSKRELKHTYRIIFQPENIGTTAYLHANSNLIPSFEFGIVMEMLGSRGHFALQRSHPGGSRIDKIAEYVLARHAPGFYVGDYGRVVGNDERVTSMPGIEIPTISVSRWPYEEYHTSDDNPSIIYEDSLQEAADIIERIIDIYDRDYIPKPTYRGSIHLSRFGMWVDWRVNLELNRRQEDIMVRLNGRSSVFEIAYELGISFDDVYDFLEKAVARGLIEKQTVMGRRKEES